MSARRPRGAPFRVERPSADGAGGGVPTLNPRVALRIAVIGGIALALLGILLTRLWFVQVIGSTEYAQAAEQNRLRTVITEAPRGNILDRNGEVIVGTKPAFNLVIRPQDVPERREEAVMGALADKLEVSRADLALLIEQQGALAPSQPVVLADNVSMELRDYVAERRSSLPGVSLEETYTRDYRQGRMAAHTLGYTGQITAETIDDYRERGYVGNERVGAAGLELQYERVLRGQPGERRVEVDSLGEPTARGTISETAPRRGNDLMTTIDIDTQAALEDQLATQVAATGSTGGAGVAIDPRTGEVLAMASYDTYNPAAFAEGRGREVARYRTSGSMPLLNRAIGGGYPAASTWKVVTGLTGLDEGFVAPDEAVVSPSCIEIYARDFCNYQQAFLGTVTMRTAIEVSSDTYFYEIGEQNYETRGRAPLQDMAEAFGFGARTGIDLPGEEPGRVPRPSNKPEFRPEEPGWLPGDDVNLSIGQGDLLISPLQLARAYATLAADGVAREPALGRRVLAAGGGRVLQDLVAGRPTSELPVTQEHIDVVKDGLFLAANGANGTSTAVFGNVPSEYRVAGKTGTAENTPNEDHSWYAGYAPYDDPQIAVAIVVERAGTGSSAAAPAVCQTMAAHFDYDRAACGTGAEVN